MFNVVALVNVLGLWVVGTLPSLRLVSWGNGLLVSVAGLGTFTLRP